MRLSTKGRYAIKAMVNIGLNNTEIPVTLQSLAKHQKISLSYLEQLFALLRKSKLVSGVRGPGGGYKLAHNPKNITISQILDAINEKQDEVIDETKKDDIIWNIFSNKIYKYLDTITLGSLIENADQIGNAITEEALITKESSVTEATIVTETSLVDNVKGI